MSIASSVQDYIAERYLPWEPVPHQPSGTCMEAAHLAQVPPSRLAKAIVLEDEEGYVLAVVAADDRIDLPELADALDRDLWLASEPELKELFFDCEPGAVPPVGEAYGIPTVWDGSLGEKPDVYFEGGDHRTLVHMSGPDFCELMRTARRVRHVYL